MIQEALSNIRKHAQADHVSVKIVESHDEIIIRITDNGKGFDVNHVFDTPPSDERYMGLRGMKERVRYFVGTVDIDFRIGKGTRIKITAAKKNNPV